MIDGATRALIHSLLSFFAGRFNHFTKVKEKLRSGGEKLQKSGKRFNEKCSRSHFMPGPVLVCERFPLRIASGLFHRANEKRKCDFRLVNLNISASATAISFKMQSYTV